ncbi:MAG TPA: hypothetical protein VLA88_05760 [Candidatus Saccharimonadales bacterium]|nr:hypothetical protein [Candidatus Saccharimonadales bacterium]
MYFSEKGLPGRYQKATRFVFVVDVPETDGVFGDYEHDGARGHHNGMRIWAEATTYAAARTLYMKMGDREWARAYQRRKAARPRPDGDHRSSDARPPASRVATSPPPSPPTTILVRVEVSGGVEVTGVLPVGDTITIPAVALEPPTHAKTNGRQVNGHGASDAEPSDGAGGADETPMVTQASPVIAVSATHVSSVPAPAGVPRATAALMRSVGQGAGRNGTRAKTN